MATIISFLSMLFMPLLIVVIICHGLYKKTSLYDTFVKGATEGLHTAYSILPFIIAIFIGINALTSSGAMDFIIHFLSPIMDFLGVPKELLSLIILRPFSGSGSLVVLQETLKSVSPDSFIGRAACVMLGSCETLFYVLALYFGVTAVKNMSHCLPVALITYFIGIAAALLVCKWL